jgi:UDP-glucuronate 4-epimerase
LGVYNIGNSRSEDLRHLLAVIEECAGRKAEVTEAPMPPGDVPDTHADLTWIKADYGFAPSTSIDAGVPRFVAWYKDYVARQA